MADWATISALATAGGTLVLAGATFSSVRSANHAARVAERSLLANLRPLLIPSRPDDPTQKITYADGKWLQMPGGGGLAEVGDEAVYLALALRNAGQGIAVLHGWHLYPEQRTGGDDHLLPDEFTRLSRDLYVPVADIGFWQGTFRDPSSPEFAAAKEARGQEPVDGRPAVRRPRGRAARDQPLRAAAPRGRRLAGRRRPPLEHRSREPALTRSNTSPSVVLFGDNLV